MATTRVKAYRADSEIAEVAISHPIAEVVSDPLRGKLDTGADITVITEKWGRESKFEELIQLV